MGHDIKNTKRPMDMYKENNVPMVTLDVRISCDTFWNYSFNIPIRIADYYDDRTSRNNATHNTRHNANANASSTCEIGRIGQADPMFVRLETYLVDYVIDHIYEDILRQRSHQRDLPILLKKARKFHIHGRTLEDILFPNSANADDHSMPNNTVYICTHC
jgi:hypothetical protein